MRWKWQRGRGAGQSFHRCRIPPNRPSLTTSISMVSSLMSEPGRDDKRLCDSQVGSGPPQPATLAQYASAAGELHGRRTASVGAILEAFLQGFCTSGHLPHDWVGTSHQLPPAAIDESR